MEFSNPPASIGIQGVLAYEFGESGLGDLKSENQKSTGNPFTLQYSDALNHCYFSGHFGANWTNSSIHLFSTLQGGTSALPFWRRMNASGGTDSIGDFSFFEIKQPTTVRVWGRLTAINRRGNNQSFPILPAPGNSFTNIPPHMWIDPPLARGYDFTMISESLFTEIEAFPVGIDGDGKFKVWVDGTTLGIFDVATTVNFQSLLGHGVKAFRITGIDPAVNSEDPTAFPIKLAWDTDVASLTMTPVLAASIAFSPAGNGLMTITYEGVLVACDDLASWAAVPGATSPYTFDPGVASSRRFFKATKPD